MDSFFLLAVFAFVLDSLALIAGTDDGFGVFLHLLVFSVEKKGMPSARLQGASSVIVTVRNILRREQCKEAINQPTGKGLDCDVGRADTDGNGDEDVEDGGFDFHSG